MAKKTTIFNIIKTELKEFVKAEKDPGGIANFFFGILIFIFAFSSMTVSTFDKICKLINPNVDIDMPWYVVLIMFIFTFIYFIYCPKMLIKIEAKKKNV